MKDAFTLIEVIFVIVVLGILAAVAIPRYFEVGDQAHEAILISFVDTLNRTVGHEMWAESMKTGHNGSVKYIGTDVKRFFRKIPKEVLNQEINLSKCGDGVYKLIGKGDPSYFEGMEYNITCKDGNAVTPPFFKLIREDGKVLASRAGE